MKRSLRVGDRLDGHFVQGHVDQTAIIDSIKDENGSFRIRFSFANDVKHLLVSKGSVCVNGISLTVIRPSNKGFEIAVIPLTWSITNLSELTEGDIVNVEFDIFGKYVEAMNSSRT